MSFVSEDPNDPTPSYVTLSQAADKTRDEWENLPRWRFLKRRKLREIQKTLSLASVMSYQRRDMS